MHKSILLPLSLDSGFVGEDVILLVGLPNFERCTVFAQVSLVVGASCRLVDWEVLLGGGEPLLGPLGFAVWGVLVGHCLFRWCCVSPEAMEVVVAA